MEHGILYVSHVPISVQIFLNEIWNHIYFTDDNWNKDFSAILTYGILYISYMKILIEIFWHKYVILYISCYKNQGTDFPTWMRTFLHFTNRNLWTDFHTCHMRFFTFNIRKSRPRYLYKNKEIFMFHIWKWVPIFPYEIWNSLCNIFEIGPSIFYVSHMNISAQIFLEEVLNTMCIT